VKSIDIKIRVCSSKEMGGPLTILLNPGKRRRYFLLKVDEKAPILNIAETLLFATMRILFKIYFNGDLLDNKKADLACDAAGDAGRLAIKKYLGYRKDE